MAKGQTRAKQNGAGKVKKLEPVPDLNEETHVPGDLIIERHHAVRIKVTSTKTILEVRRACGHSSTMNLGVDMDITQEFDFILTKGIQPGQVSLFEACLACEREAAIREALAQRPEKKDR